MIHLLIASIHLTALGMLESGGDNFQVGTHGEVSQYQIMPKIWFDKAGTAVAHDPKISFIVAKKIWQARVVQFEKKNQRPPTLEELAYLWHCPARCFKPTQSDKDYAQRFANLIHAHEQDSIKAKTEETHGGGKPL